jgi:hypothetical protein
VAFFKYFLIRVAIFVPLFLLFLLIQLGAVYSAVAAGIGAFCISYLFFRRQRDAAVDQMANRFRGNSKPIRGATELSDASAEDSLVDANPDVTVSSDRRKNTVHFDAPPAASIPAEFLD